MTNVNETTKPSYAEQLSLLFLSQGNPGATVQTVKSGL